MSSPTSSGCSNLAIARTLYVGEQTVESHIGSVFSKLDLLPEPDDPLDANHRQ